MNTIVNNIVYKINQEFTLKILSVLDEFPITETEPYYSVLSSQLSEDNFMDRLTVLQIKKFLMSSLPRKKSINLIREYDNFLEEYKTSENESVNKNTQE
jgi:hypothetical protein|uniref:Uncharacterized protein n=1 Tax=Myoviridae sp. ctBDS4 TaxID=2823537 RepID=A0A8S5LEH7_9CAUD|nr:MAG TPA: hypothetical protein [Myoviridae sp. ctBDS4]